jgi:hypothetical protein
MMHHATTMRCPREWRNGRRASLRSWCPKGRGGSNPPSRTGLQGTVVPGQGRKGYRVGNDLTHTRALPRPRQAAARPRELRAANCPARAHTPPYTAKTPAPQQCPFLPGYARPLATTGAVPKCSASRPCSIRTNTDTKSFLKMGLDLFHLRRVQIGRSFGE